MSKCNILIRILPVAVTHDAETASAVTHDAETASAAISLAAC